MDPEAFEGVGEAGRSGEGRAGGTVKGRLGCVGVRSMSGVVGVDGSDMAARHTGSRFTTSHDLASLFRVPVEGCSVGAHVAALLSVDLIPDSIPRAPQRQTLL